MPGNAAHRPCARLTCPFDFLRGVTKGAKHPVVEAGPTGLAKEKGIDVLPDDIFSRRYLKVRPSQPSQISVLSLGRRCAPEMYGLKKLNRD
jgi:hypothetical protein